MVKIKEFFRHYLLIIVLAFTATIVGIVVVLLPKPTPISEKPKPPIIKPPQFNQANIAPGNIFYQLDLKETPLQLPNTLPVYQARPRETFDWPRIISQNLEGPPIVKNATEAAGLAKGFLSQHNRWTPELEAGDFEIKFLKIGGFEVFPTENFEKADLLAIHFWPKIDNLIIVVGQNPNIGGVEVWVAKNGKVQKVKENLANLDTSNPVEYPIISFTQAWEKITQQKGTIVVLSKQEEEYGVSQLQLSSVIINKVYLAYFQEQNLPAKLQPIWVLQGKTILANREESGVSIYLPAILEL
jgi:hypothetical protein